jgi:hypothetical protein
MTTSANSIEYSIYKDDEQVGHFRVNIMCRFPDYAELLKYQPLSEHTIQAWGYDEEEDEWSDDPENLEDFLRGMKSNKWLKAYFTGEKTVEQIMQEFKDINDEMVRKMHEHFAKEREKFKNK